MRPTLLSLALIAAFAVPSASTAAETASRRLPTPELIELAVERGEIGRGRGLVLLARALGAPERLPVAFRSDAPWDGTLPLLELREEAFSLPEGEQRQEIDELLEEAATSCGPNSGNLHDVAASSHFFVEYKESALQPSLPIESYLASLETSWETEIVQFGWAAPPVAPVPAPESKYHVRVDELSDGLYGFVSPVGTYAGAVGNNPSTPWNDVDASASCMVLNANYDPFPGTAQQALDATTAHELNHSIQFGYGALAGDNRPDDVFVEGGATWMEDHVFDSSNDSYNYLWPKFDDGMGEYDGSNLGGPYAYWVVLRALTERFGVEAEDVMQLFWELTSMGSADTLHALDQALLSEGVTLASAFHSAAIALKLNLACSETLAHPFCLEEGPAYTVARGETEVHGSVSGSLPASTTGPIEDHYATQWIALPAAGPYDVSIVNTSSGAAPPNTLRVTVACATASTVLLHGAAQPLAEGASLLVRGVDPSDCTTTPVAVITNDTHISANPGSSTSGSFSVLVGAAGGMATLSVSKMGSGGGTVAGTGISCGTDCTETLTPPQIVSLTATPDAGSAFVGWAGACIGTANPCAVTVDEAESVTARFEEGHSLNVALQGTGSGTVSGTGIDCPGDCTNSYAHGTVVTLTRAADPGSTFAGWGGACSGAAATCVVTMDQAKTVTATFQGMFTLTAARAGPGAGSVTSDPPGILCGADCTEAYLGDSIVTLRAVPDADSTFSGWSGACTGVGLCTVQVEDDLTAVATFGLSDTQPPPAPTIASLPRFQRSTSFPVAWGTSETATFDVVYRTAGVRRGFGPSASLASGTSSTKETFAGAPGRTACFSALARDAAGNASAFGSEGCTTIPADDRLLAKDGAWARRSGSGHFRGTFSEARERGAALVLKGVRAARLAVLVTRCRGCGSLDVLWKGRLLKRIKLGAAATKKKRLVELPPFASVQTGKLMLVVRSDGKPVRVDGVGVSPV